MAAAKKVVPLPTQKRPQPPHTQPPTRTPLYDKADTLCRHVAAWGGHPKP